MDERNLFETGAEDTGSTQEMPAAPQAPIPGAQAGVQYEGAQEQVYAPEDAVRPGAQYPAGELYEEPHAPAADEPAGEPGQKPARGKKRSKKYEEDDDDYYYDDDAASRRAGIGCLVTFLIFLAIVGGVLLYAFSWYKAETGGKHATATQSITIDVTTGAGASTVGKSLEANGMIGNSMVFRLYARYLTDESPSFMAGSYTLEPGMSYDEIIEALSEGMAQREFTTMRIADGMTIMGIANRFEEEGFCTAEEFLAMANDLQRFADIPVIAKSLESVTETETDYIFHLAEGHVFPDTYEFFLDADLEDIVRTIYEHLDSKFTDEVYARMAELDISVRDVITFASLIQAESSYTSEMPRVSRIFWNRLEGRSTETSTLGSDVTVRYVKQWLQYNNPDFGRVFDDIGYEEARDAVGLERFYAYITQDWDGNSRTGLPRGALCSVTESAIRAVLWPTEEEEFYNYFFFLTDDDDNFYYAATYAEHLVNDAAAAQVNAEVAQRKAAEEAAAAEEGED